jgi:hypothetical protein
VRNAIVMLGAPLLCGIVLAAQSPAIPDAEREAIVKAALDYGDGFYSGAPERMERAIHPDLNKVYVAPIPQTGRFLIGYSTYSGLIEMSRARSGFLEPEKRKIQASALYLNGDVACAKVTSAMFNDYLTLVKIDGAWKIVNVLWVPGPDTPNRPPVPAVDATRDKEAINRAAEDFIQGALSGDVARLEKVLHAEVSRAALGVLPSGRTAIMRSRYSALVEPVRAKLSVVPEGARGADIKILDVMDGMAFVEVSASSSWNYLQMTVLDGQWKILNILTKRKPGPPPPAQK